MKITLLKWTDRILGGIAARLFPAGRGGKAVAPGRILLIRPGGMGDACLLIPAIRALKREFPLAHISVLAERRNSQIFNLCPVDTLLLYDTPSDLFTAIRGRYDLVIDTEQWYRLSALVARLTGAPMRIGFAGNERKRLFTHPIPYPEHEYEALSFFRLLGPLGIQAPSRVAVPFVELPAAAVDSAQRLLAPLAGRAFVTVFPGASVPQKQWGVLRFRELAARLALYGMPVVLVGGEDVSGDAQAIASASGAINLAGKASLEVTAAIIGKGRALVSGDSGLLHVAAGLGTPTVSLFGPSDPGKWAPKGEKHVVLTAGLSCAPCSRFGTIPPCPDGERCLSGITVAAVLDALEKLLSESKGAQGES